MAKATRRDLRRAMGPAALNTMQDFEQGIAVLQSGLGALQREIVTLTVAHASQRQHVAAELKALADCLVEHANRLTARDERERTFLGRLRVLLFGR